MNRRTGFVTVLTTLVLFAAAVAGSSLGSGTQHKAASGTVVLSGWGANPDELKLLNFLDLNWEVVEREIARGRQQRRAGPSAENILRDLGNASARIA